MAKKVKLTKGGQTVYPATVMDAVVHPDLRVSASKLIDEVNVSKIYPTGGIDGTNKYTLETAIAMIPASLRTVGLKCSFLDEHGEFETWEWKGVAFTAIANWLQIGANRIAELAEIELTAMLINNGLMIKGKIAETHNQSQAINPDDPTQILSTGFRNWYPVTAAKSIFIKGSNTTNIRIGIWAFYNGVNRNNYIGGLKIQEIGTSEYNEIIEVPTDANYLCISSKTLEVFELNKITTNDEVETLSDNVDKTISAIEESKSSIKDIKENQIKLT